MELLQAIHQDLVTPQFTARYCAVTWEPLAGTGERLVGLVSVQAHEKSVQAIAPGTYCVISPERLRQLLGKQRGNSAAGILARCAEFMTQRQLAGMPLEELKPLFHGFEMGPPLVARAYSVEQLLDAAVRSVSAFGSADEMIQEEEQRVSPRHMVRTAEFITQLRRIFTADSKDFADRFDVPVRGHQGIPDVTIDYAHGALAVQVTSLPTTAKQAQNSEREAQAKMFELDIARNQMGANPFRPTLLFNTDALADESTDAVRDLALAARGRLLEFARYKNLDVLEASTPGLAAQILDRAA